MINNQIMIFNKMPKNEFQEFLKSLTHIKNGQDQIYTYTVDSTAATIYPPEPEAITKIYE